MKTFCARCLVNGTQSEPDTLVAGTALCFDHGIDAYLSAVAVPTADARSAKDQISAARKRSGRVHSF
jgi:hypothetical protein